MKQETALIVGAGSASRLPARLFAKEGLRVAVAARDTSKLASLVKETGRVPGLWTLRVRAGRGDVRRG